MNHTEVYFRVRHFLAIDRVTCFLTHYVALYELIIGAGKEYNLYPPSFAFFISRRENTVRGT